MIGVALKGLLGRKLRAALTAVSIVLGVAMISGTYVLTDTIKAAFGTVFALLAPRLGVIAALSLACSCACLLSALRWRELAARALLAMRVLRHPE